MLPCQFSGENMNGICDHTLMCYKFTTILVTDVGCTNMAHQKNIETIGEVSHTCIILNMYIYKHVHTDIIIIPLLPKPFLIFGSETN